MILEASSRIAPVNRRAPDRGVAARARDAAGSGGTRRRRGGEAVARAPAGGEWGQSTAVKPAFVIASDVIYQCRYHRSLVRRGKPRAEDARGRVSSSGGSIPCGALGRGSPCKAQIAVAPAACIARRPRRPSWQHGVAGDRAGPRHRPRCRSGPGPRPVEPAGSSQAGGRDHGIRRQDKRCLRCFHVCHHKC